MDHAWPLPFPFAAKLQSRIAPSIRSTAAFSPSRYSIRYADGAFARLRTSLDFIRSCVRPSLSVSPSGVSLRESAARSEEHTSELQSLRHLVCRLLLEKKKKRTMFSIYT